jgi:hypothetical protein
MRVRIRLSKKIDFSDSVDFMLTAVGAIVKSAVVMPSDQSYREVNEEPWARINPAH